METERGEGRQAGSPATFRLLPALADFIFLWLNLGQQHAAGWRMPLQEKAQDDQSQQPRNWAAGGACDLGLPSGAQGEMGWGVVVVLLLQQAGAHTCLLPLEAVRGKDALVCGSHLGGKGQSQVKYRKAIVSLLHVTEALSCLLVKE